MLNQHERHDSEAWEPQPTLDLPTFYAVIPAVVRYHPKMSPAAKLMFGEISALANVKGFCYATNAYFQRVFDCAERSVQGWLDQLTKAGFVRVELDGSKTRRRIFIAHNYSNDPAKKRVKAPAKKCTHNTQDKLNTPVSNSGDSAPVVPDAGESKPPEVEDDQPSPHQAFIDLWSESFKMQFGRDYVFAGGKDAMAVKRLLAASKKTPKELIDIATRAWAKKIGKRFNCERATSISIFASAFNEIMAELDPPGASGPVATKEPPPGLKPFSQQPPPGFDEAMVEIGVEEWKKRFPSTLYYDDVTKEAMS